MAGPGKPGRPRAFDGDRGEAKRVRILEAIAAGNTRDCASKLAGVSTATLYEEMGRNPEFAEAVDKADADAEARNVEIVQRAGEKTWQAAAWWLERRRYQEFGKKERLEIVDAEEEARKRAASLGLDTETTERLITKIKEFKDKGRLKAVS